jgi:hypothetical protein
VFLRSTKFGDGFFQWGDNKFLSFQLDFLELSTCKVNLQGQGRELALPPSEEIKEPSVLGTTKASRTPLENKFIFPYRQGQPHGHVT